MDEHATSFYGAGFRVNRCSVVAVKIAVRKKMTLKLGIPQHVVENVGVAKRRLVGQSVPPFDHKPPTARRSNAAVRHSQQNISKAFIV